MTTQDTRTLPQFNTELVGLLKDLSQYLKVQGEMGNDEVSFSEDAAQTIGKWGTPAWQSCQFVSQGLETAPLMVVDSQAKFFKGPAGELLVKILRAMHLPPAKVFICNAADPSRIRDHVRANPPRCILCLGEPAGRCLLDRRDRLNDFRGSFFTYEGVPVMATHHPQALLENQGLKRQAWEDVQQVMGRLGQTP